VDEEAGSKHREVMGEAVGSVWAAAIQRTQAITAPALLINTEEPAHHAEHTHWDGHVIHTAGATVQPHKQVFGRAIQAVKFTDTFTIILFPIFN